MILKSIAFVCLFSGLAAPAFTQVIRSAESQSVNSNKDGNVVTEYFRMQIIDNSSYETQAETLKKAKEEELKNKRIAFFVKYIGLTNRESERFWPIYNEYDEKRKELNERSQKILQQLTSDPIIATISDKGAIALLDSYMVCVEKDRQVQLEYHKKFLAILPTKKIAKVYHAEYMFRLMLLQELLNGGR